MVNLTESLNLFKWAEEIHCAWYRCERQRRSRSSVRTTFVHHLFLCKECLLFPVWSPTSVRTEGRFKGICKPEMSTLICQVRYITHPGLHWTVLVLWVWDPVTNLSTCLIPSCISLFESQRYHDDWQWFKDHSLRVLSEQRTQECSPFSREMALRCTVQISTSLTTSTC